MSYRALYRVFRPQQFKDVIGQTHISQTLKNALCTNRLAHAYLFCGPRGTGKTSSAKILAKAVNCLDLHDGEPCNQCSHCQGINDENFMDVLEIDAASNRGIDEIRDIRDKVKFTPSAGKRKVYIIDEVHMLTNEAFNALLKTLEEPPEHVLFILATTDPQKIPMTVLSRCQRFDFKKIGVIDIQKHLKEIAQEQEIEISDEAVNIIAMKASGGMRDAISVLDQCIAFAGGCVEAKHVQMVLGSLGEEDMIQITQQVIDGNYHQLFSKLGVLVEQGKDIKQIIRDLIGYSRQLLLIKVAPNEAALQLSNEMTSLAQKQAQALTVTFLSQMINRLNEVEKDMRYANQPQILLEAALVDLVLMNQGAVMVAAPAMTQTMGNQQPSATIPTVTAVKPVAQPARKVIISDNIKQAWPEVMNRVKQASIKTHAFLLPAQPLGLEDGKLVLKFDSQSKFHHEKSGQIENMTVLEDILKSMTDQPLKVTLYLEGAEGQRVEDDFSVVEEAIRLFGEEHVIVE